MKQMIKFADLKVEGLQMREAISEADVAEYMEKMEDGVVFDPLVVIGDGTNLYLVDGFHRLEAMKRRGLTEAEAEVSEGTRTDALRLSLTANAQHGKKLTPGDIQHKLEIAWANRVELFGGTPSHEVLAKACAVSKKTVQRFLKRLSTVDSVHSSEEQTLISIDGKKRKVASTVDRVHSNDASPTVDSVHSSETQSTETPAKAAMPTNVTAKAVPVDGGCIFKDYLNNPEEEKAREEYICSLYGTFSEKTHRLVKDRHNCYLPRRLGRELDYGLLHDYEVFADCICKAVNFLDELKDTIVFKRIMGVKGRPLIELTRLNKACEYSRYQRVCPHCKGKGCDWCASTGFQTIRDILRDRRQGNKGMVVDKNGLPVYPSETQEAETEAAQTEAAQIDAAVIEPAEDVTGCESVQPEPTNTSDEESELDAPETDPDYPDVEFTDSIDAEQPMAGDAMAGLESLDVANQASEAAETHEAEDDDEDMLF